MEPVCRVCGLRLPSRNKLFRHIAANHSSSQISDGNGTTEVELTDRCELSQIRIVADDECYRVVCKPQGVPTMGVHGVETLYNSDTMLLSNAFSDRLSYKKALPCHRLDRATGGLVLCSKSKAAEVMIKGWFRDRLVHKRYRAIVMGKMGQSEGVIDEPIDSQESVTKYKVVNEVESQRYGYISTLDLWPITGRKHQLRRHLQSKGHPIIGDPKYSSALTWPDPPFNILFLWALELQFPAPADFGIAERHPSHSVAITIDEPRYYEDFRRSQCNYSH